jgi:MYXO-CTERM domain-containing protein
MRAWIAAVTWLVASPAVAQVTLNAANGTHYVVQDTGGGQLSGPSAFGGWPGLCVRVCADCDTPCDAADVYDAGGHASTSELGGLQRALATESLAGLDVRRKVFVPSAGPARADGFIRYLDLLSNPTDAAITVSVRIGSTGAGVEHLGYGADVHAWRTSDDDAQIEDTDRWVLTDDSNANGGIGAIAHLIHGAGARFVPTHTSLAFALNDDPSALAWDFRNVVVPAHDQVAILTVLAYDPLRSDALSEVLNLVGMPPELMFGLSDAERRAIVNFDVDPGNASPVADAGGPYNAPEGTQVQLSAVGSVDPDAAALQYFWDLDGDGQFDDANGANAVVTFHDNGGYLVSVRVVDPGGKADVDTARVTVTNVPPRVDAVLTDALPIDEGSELTVEVQTTEPGADQLTFDFDWDGDGNYDELDVAANRWQHRYLTDGDFTAHVRVKDDDGGESVHDFPVQVRNLPPQIFDIVSNTPAPEGAQVTINVVAQDPGDDPMTFEYDLDGDGVYEQSGVGLDQVQTSFPSDGLHTINVRVSDDTGASVERQERLPILNARPVIDVVRDNGPVVEGSPIRIEVVAHDPGNDPLTYSFDLDNDGDFVDDVLDQPDIFVDHVFPQQGFYTIGVRVKDDSGDFALGVDEIEVTNGAPTGTIDAPEFVDEGQLFNLTVDAHDPGDDQLLYDWDIDGDGAYDLLGTREAVRQVSLRQEGHYSLHCRVRDGDGGALQLTAEVQVRNVAPTVSVMAMSPGDEGTEIPVQVTATDPGGDTLHYSYDFDGDGVYELENLDRNQINALYDDQGTYTLRVLVDDGTDTTTAETQVEVVNVPPRITLQSNSPVAEGDDLIFTATAEDPGDDTVTLEWDFNGDGQADFTGGIDQLQRTIVAPDDSRVLATLIARDEDGGETRAQTQVIITNVAPTLIEVAEPPPALENQPYNLTMVATDPAGVNDDLRFGLIDPPPGVDIDAVSGRFQWTPTFQDFLNSPVTIRVRVDDGDGGRDETTLHVPVLPEDHDNDGLPDTYERRTCNAQDMCLDPADPNDAMADPDGDGRSNQQEFADGTDPFTYEGPTVPELVAPDDGERVRTLTPDLVVNNVEGTPGHGVAIEYEIYDDVNAIDHADPLFTSDPVPQAADTQTTSWKPAAGLLLEDKVYYWRARGVDDVAHSAWSVPRSFRTNASNQAPSAPQLRSPADGTQVTELRPAFEALPSEDPDGDDLTYVFRIYHGTGADAVLDSSELGQLQDGVVRFVPQAALIENVTYSWEVVARDEQDAVSDPSERWTFTVNTMNQQPTKPTIVFPATGMLVTELKPTFVAGGSTDNDSPSVSYVFTLRDENGDEMARSEALAPDGENASWQAPMDLNENGFHTLEVVATDGLANSDVASIKFFVSAMDEPPPAPKLLAPSDTAQGVADDVALVWAKVEDPERTHVTYEATWCREDGGCTTSPRSSSLNTIPGNLKAGATYTWSVKAFDEGGLASVPSDKWKFTVQSSKKSGGGCGCDATESGASPWALVLLAAGLTVLRRRRA